MAPSQSWDPASYEKHARFVSELGTPVLELLDPRPGERILDLGCGDGFLTERIAARGCDVLGVDASPAQVAAARARGLRARVCQADAIPFVAQFDAVFSNAVLHWIPEHGPVLARIHAALRSGGRFVAEFGGAGNVASIRAALTEVLGRRGVDAAQVDPWFFPSAEAYRQELESRGFRVAAIGLFPRPTLLPGELSDWLETFAQPFLAAVPDADRASVAAQVQERLGPQLFRPGSGWVVDYVRLRLQAFRGPAGPAGSPPDRVPRQP